MDFRRSGSSRDRRRAIQSNTSSKFGNRSQRKISKHRRPIYENYCCTICENIPTEAKALNCGHVFCKACLQELIDSDQTLQSFSCPMCRTPVYKTQEGADSFSNVTSFSSNARTTLCSNCRSDASFNCLHCDKHFCERCKMRHVNKAKTCIESLTNLLEEELNENGSISNAKTADIIAPIPEFIIHARSLFEQKTQNINELMNVWQKAEDYYNKMKAVLNEEINEDSTERHNKEIVVAYIQEKKTPTAPFLGFNVNPGTNIRANSRIPTVTQPALSRAHRLFWGRLYEEVLKALHHRYTRYIGVFLLLVSVARIVCGILIAQSVFEELSRFTIAFLFIKGIAGVLFWASILYHKQEPKIRTSMLLLSIVSFLWMIIGTFIVFDKSHLQREHFTTLAVLQVSIIVDWALFGFCLCFVILKAMQRSMGNSDVNTIV